MDYIQKPKNPDKTCVFCSAPAEADGEMNLIVHRGEGAYVILNLYPYTSGHVMIVPYEHCATLAQLDSQVRGEIMELANHAINTIGIEYKAQGFNVGFNIGEAAGAGISEHIHMHVVPRWQADTNFMTALGMTRVLPESLVATYQRLKQAWNKQ